jgi:CheY-like chemotaxis protein
VESTYGEGSSFHVVIPNVTGDEALIYNAVSNEITLYAPDAKVLVVDDNEMNLSVARGLLRLYKINGETAKSGQQAVDMVRQNKYDLVFMDHMMPEMDGIEATRIIRESGITVPIIAFTANATLGAREIMLAAGMDDYLSKPISKKEFAYMLNTWLPREKLLVPPADTVDDEAAAGEKTGARVYKTTAAETEESIEFWRKVNQIEGLSISIGLDRIEGERELFKKTLKLMLYEIEKSDKNLREFLAAGDMGNFSIEVHGIKGSLANIGAMELAETAYALETASGKKDKDYCVSNLPDFLEKLSGLGQKLQEAFSATDPADEPMEIPPELPAILLRLTVAFSETDLALIDTEVENLDALNPAGSLKNEIERIKDAVMMMDYDSATEHISKLIAKAG